MPTPAYMSVEGVSQGLITEGAMTEDSIGNLYQEEHEDEFIVQAFEHNIFVPVDPQSGQPTGVRKHGVIKVTKMFDKSSPMLYQALVSGERLECTINWFRTGSEGAQEHYFTHELEGAVITDITAIMPNCLDPSKASFTHMEEVSFGYATIRWTHEIGGTEGSDDWRTMGGGS